MKKTIATVCLSGLIIFGLSSMKDLTTGITGKVTPVDGVEAVWAIKDADTVKTAVGTAGDFTLEVTPGTYRVIVSAKAPYRNAEMKDLVVTADSTVNIGEIKLDK